ncbi:MAG: MFS transporter [Flammeovirgaceae bacterium]|jgi:MFS family permease|nr:MFS transporter [Flammeovirgaceae bacterium]
MINNHVDAPSITPKVKIYTLSFWLLCASSFLFFGSFSMILPELPDYLASLNGQEYLGLVVSLFTLSAAVSRPFSGKLTDKWGRIPVMFIGACISGLAAMIYPLTTTVFGFLSIRLLHGFSAGFKPTGTSAYVADIIPANRRGEALGILSMFGTIGMASAPIFGSWIFLTYDINTLFYISSVFSIGSVLILFGMKETLKNKEPFKLALLKIGKADLYEPSVIPPSLIMMLTTFSFGTVITLSPDFSGFLGIHNKGLFFSFFTGSSLLVRFLGGKLSDHFGRILILRYSTLCLCISMIIIGFSTDSTSYFAGAFLFGIGYGLNSPTLFAWAVDLSPEKSIGRGISTLFIFLEVGIGVGSLISGSFYQGFTTRFPWLFMISSFFSFIAFIIVLTKKR